MTIRRIAAALTVAGALTLTAAAPAGAREYETGRTCATSGREDARSLDAPRFAVYSMTTNTSCAFARAAARKWLAAGDHSPRRMRVTSPINGRTFTLTRSGYANTSEYFEVVYRDRSSDVGVLIQGDR